MADFGFFRIKLGKSSCDVTVDIRLQQETKWCTAWPSIVIVIARKELVLVYFSFPTNEKVRKEWILKVKRKAWKPSIHSKLCSEHFKDDCFVQDRVIVASIYGSETRKASFKTRSNSDKVFLQQREYRAFYDNVQERCLRETTQTRGNKYYS